MKLRQSLALLRQDLKRYDSLKNPFVVLMKSFHNPGMIFSIIYRSERYLLYESNKLFKILGILVYPLYFLITYYIFNYHIEPIVKIMGGMFLHNFDIVITDNTEIGSNFSCMGGVTLGTNFNKEAKIVVGNNVSIGTGAKIIASGDLIIADNITIGANAVVTKSLTVVGATYIGIPARLISHDA